MLCRDIIAVCSQIHTNHINVWAERGIVNVKLVVYCALKGQLSAIVKGLNR
jgi:hypothetical protein